MNKLGKKYYFKNKCNVGLKKIAKKYAFFCFFQEAVFKKYMDYGRKAINYHYLTEGSCEETSMRVNLGNHLSEILDLEDKLFFDLEEGEELYIIYKRMFSEVRGFIFNIQLLTQSSKSTLCRGII